VAGVVRRALALALLAALPAALAAASTPPQQEWTQFGGAGRSGVADIAGDLDVLAAYNATPGGFDLHMGSIGPFPTAHGVVGLRRDGGAGSCQLWRLDDPLQGTVISLGPPIDCPQGGQLSAALPSEDAVLVCIDAVPQAGPNGLGGLDQLLQARSARDGSLLWAVGPGTPPAPAQQGQSGAWGCGDIGVDVPHGLLAVPFHDPQGANRLAAFGLLDHKPLWNVTFTPADQLPAVPNVVPVPAVPRATDADGNVALDSATFTANGIVVTGKMVNAALSSAGLPAASVGTEANLVTPFAAWLALDGRVVGSFALATQGGAGAASEPVLMQSEHAAGLGTFAAAALGNDLLVVDPAQALPVRHAALGAEAVTQQGELAAPVWMREGLWMPFVHQAFGCDARQSACVAWPAFNGGAIRAAVSPGDGTVWTLVKRPAGAVPLADLVRVRIETDMSATELERLPIPLSRPDPYSQDPGRYGHDRLVPLGGGRLLVLGTGGEAAVLGLADDVLRPSLVLDDAEPDTNHVVHATLGVPSGAPAVRQVLVGWGDGLLESDGPHDALAYQFRREGIYQVRATVVYADNRTATAIATAHVGALKQPPQGIVALLFSPAYQNYTFFALGILVTVIGSVLTAIGVAKGRRRIDRRLREMDRIQDDGRRDPFAAVRALHDYRQERRRDLAEGHLSDTQYTVLETHAEHVLQILRQRILGGFVERVSESFAHALDLALADGSIDAGEGSRLAELVDREADLSKAERGRLLEQLRSWQRAIG